MDTDVMYVTDESVRQPLTREPQPGGTIRYGDRFVLRSCASVEPRFVSIVRRKAGKRVPSALSVNAGLSGAGAQADAVWTFVPATRAKNRVGEPVSFGDAVRLQLFDYCGNYRLLAMGEADSGSVTALRAPCARDLSTWFVACTGALRADDQGQMLPSGPVNRYLRYGKDCYITLTQAGRYLCLTPAAQGTNSHGIGTLSDWPRTGLAIFWHADRCTDDAR
ncbi:hypothetical protein WKR88_00310 [Trinickia caryophylli]|uniref:Uncharacterized protein n=1 Tax=Trinickia caryophylli TaxID=28094 RepID=A0A1X7D0X9_TRICW|nr:hypothetical protein [Trinickia caryophylli]PMS13559.1 hypothetical protein C0Z17_04565 [Trinickia caryophylli]TRX15274.1 hypothetical protein FNF07_29295 [Trinickia caryophylli]WQE15150.1 hypothetical protein U0034_21620 [Trinickia caryophylli]SMF06604.1 hypothetical protein SAMN06295900_102235 [Trinickia caryophylli]GLU31111.1 hypothetical protein Busp01_09530 [Trinickia caryophylli]